MAGCSPALAALAALAAVAPLGGLAACAEAQAECRLGADCPSGACSGAGRCLPSSADAAAALDADGGPDDATALDDASSVLPDAGSWCLPNHDGVIARNEIGGGPGLGAAFRIAQGASVDSAGSPEPQGRRRWDLASALPGDHRIETVTDPVAGQWFAAAFSGAGWAAKLSDSSDLLGVFELTDTALRLVGVVSPGDGPLRTELSYDPPVDVLRFPLALGSTWTTQASHVSGVALGVPSSYFEDYRSTAVAAGDIVTPYATFDGLRVAVTLTRTVGVVPTVVQTSMYVTECFGAVATLTSEDDEPNPDFSTAAEVRRLSP
jgi:hypothetical protein